MNESGRPDKLLRTMLASIGLQRYADARAAFRGGLDDLAELSAAGYRLVMSQVAYILLVVMVRKEREKRFCDKSGKVLCVIEQMKPWRFGRFVRGGYYTLELPGGSLQGRVHLGDELIFN